jgi:hypothetical protein
MHVYVQILPITGRPICGMDKNDPVYMIGHDHKRPQLHVRKPLAQPPPFPLHHLPHRAQAHLPRHHLPKQAFPLPRANRDKIRPRLGVIIARQADGMAVVFWGVKSILQSYLG